MLLVVEIATAEVVHQRFGAAMAELVYELSFPVVAHADDDGNDWATDS